MRVDHQTLSLRAKIYLTVILLLTLCCVVSGIGWVGQSKLLANFDRYQQAESVLVQVLEIDRNVLQLKAQTENYIHSGAESKYSNARELLMRLLSQIETTQQSSDNAELIDSLGEMAGHLSTFGEQLELAAEERNVRTTLAADQLPQKAGEVDLAFEQLKNTLVTSLPGKQALIAGEAVNGFDQSQESLLQYLIDPDAKPLQEMFAGLSQARNKMELIESAADQESRATEDCRNVLQRLTEFEKLALRVVQATRGYLYYSHVVMAGEISEFTYYSEKAKAIVERQRMLNQSSRSIEVGRTRALVVIASLLALLLATVLATRLSYAIVQPLSLLTNSFKRLAAGETLDDIPGSQRTDEIGRMSQAAKVFSDKNHQTTELLARSQALSKELSEKARALEETNLELDNFAYIASHDLKSPLRGINSLASWVQEDCMDLLPASSQKHLVQMQDRVGMMNSLLDDLLEYSRVGRVNQESEPVDLDAMVRSILEIVDNPMKMELRMMGPFPEISTAIAPIKQVIMNLITNAIKYNDKGSQGVVDISCQDHGDWLNVSVVDNGPGIDPRFHKRVFEMYQRIASKDVEGSGMGLAIVKKQVEHHGGQLTLQSDLDEGCRMEFTWPKQTHFPKVE